MKTKKWIFIMTLGVVLIAAFLTPWCIAGFEDYSLQEKKVQVEIETVNLTPDDSYSFQELTDIQSFYYSSRTCLETGQKLSRGELVRIVNDLMKTLFGKEDVTFNYQEYNCFAYPSEDLQKIYMVWECVLTDQDQNQYYFLIDDNTGKMLAFTAPLWQVEALEAGEVDQLYNILSDYYDLGQVKILDENDYWKYEKGNDITYSQSTIIVESKENGTLCLPLFIRYEWVVFNMYPEALEDYFGIAIK